MKIISQETVNGKKILDLDALAQKEKENWVYKGGNYHPEGKRVLLYFSRGGKDASIIREFDLIKKEFVKGGFYFPESRSRGVSWISEDEIAIATDWETKDSLTNSNYPRILKTIKRGEPISSAVTLFEGKETDISVVSWILPSEDKGDRLIIERYKDYFSQEFFLRKRNKKIVKIPLPVHIDIRTSFQGNFVIKLQKPWAWQERHYKLGSILIVNPDKLIERELSAVQLLMEPTSEKVLSSAKASKNSIYISVLDNVKNSIIELKPEGASWKEKTHSSAFFQHSQTYC